VLRPPRPAGAVASGMGLGAARSAAPAPGASGRTGHAGLHLFGSPLD
jgi:hypothetical protein